MAATMPSDDTGNAKAYNWLVATTPEDQRLVLARRRALPHDRREVDASLASNHSPRTAPVA
jgi:hypothetical protein